MLASNVARRSGRVLAALELGASPTQASQANLLAASAATQLTSSSITAPSPYTTLSKPSPSPAPIPCSVAHDRGLVSQVQQGWGCNLSFAASFAKGHKSEKVDVGHDRKHAKHHKQVNKPDPEHVPDYAMEPFAKLMQQAVAHLQQELAAIRTGRATPGLLEPVTVVGHAAHGHTHAERKPLSAYGTVTARSPQLLVVSCFNPSDLELVAQAVAKSPLQLPARVEGGEVLVPVPRPSLEAIEKLVKLVQQEAEKAKVSIRGTRHKALDLARKAIDAEGELQRAEKEIQKVVDKYVGEVDKLKAAKEKDLRQNH